MALDKFPVAVRLVIRPNHLQALRLSRLKTFIDSLFKHPWSRDWKWISDTDIVRMISAGAPASGGSMDQLPQSSRPSLSESTIAQGPIPLFDGHIRYLTDSYLAFFQERYALPS